MSFRPWGAEGLNVTFSHAANAKTFGSSLLVGMTFSRFTRESLIFAQKQERVIWGGPLSTAHRSLVADVRVGYYFTR